jgi:hypothetical protein
VIGSRPVVSAIYLKDRRVDRRVAASLVDGVTEAHLEDVVRLWQPARDRGLESLKRRGESRQSVAQSSHWDWRQKLARISGLLAYRSFAVECEGVTQGLMIATTAEVCRHPEQSLRPLVYVDYLETAPWNQGALSDAPRFTGVGSVLLAAAVQLSVWEGFQGRLGLHSLPQSESFYQRLGMFDMGFDNDKEGLRYFEFLSDGAEEFLKR